MVAPIRRKIVSYEAGDGRLYAVIMLEDLVSYACGYIESEGVFCIEFNGTRYSVLKRVDKDVRDEVRRFFDSLEDELDERREWVYSVYASGNHKPFLRDTVGFYEIGTL